MRVLAAVYGVLAVVGAMTVPPPVQAGAPIRRGFWISFGLGYGSAQAQCDQCVAGDRVGSVSGTIRLGGTLGQHWLLGWEGSGWLRNSSTSWLPVYGGADQTLGSSSLVALFYPSAASGLFVRAGAGVSFAGFSYGDCTGDDCSIVEGPGGTGFGLTAGLGYDLRIGRNTSLTPELTYVKGFARDLDDGGRTVATQWTHDYWAVNLCLTFH
jgi:hypothetical protein